MTIAIAWTRAVAGCEELVFVTDSRLSGDGCNFDACPKVITLPRSDCAIAFAGYTGHAYPMMQQLALAIDAHAPLKRGSMDIVSLKTYALKIFQSMSAEIRSSEKTSTPSDTAPDVEFLFGGYSWIKKKFQLWRFVYSRSDQRFTANPANTITYAVEAGKFVVRQSKSPRGKQIGKIAFAGDQASLARELLLGKLNKAEPEKADLDWLPLEVVQDMLNDPQRSETIGGAPQIVKVYQYMRSATIGIKWVVDGKAAVHLQGRRLLDYERTEKFVLDPDTLISSAHMAVTDQTDVTGHSEYLDPEP